MIRPELDALLHGALDDTLTPDEQARLAQILSESPDARARAAELQQLAGLIDSLGPVEAPPSLAASVLKEVSHHPRALRPSTIQRGVAVNKKILFGLAAAAAIVLAVITYNSNPPATVGTEATIGAAQRAQTPQIAAKDVKLGDTTTQDVLQTETFDAIMKDETLRTMLQDAKLREQLQRADFRQALTDDNIKQALLDQGLARRFEDAALIRALNDPQAAKKYDDANMRWLLSNKAFVDALKVPQVRELLARNNAAAALAGPAMQRALLDKGFDAAIRQENFAARLAAGARVY